MLIHLKKFVNCVYIILRGGGGGGGGSSQFSFYVHFQVSLLFLVKIASFNLKPIENVMYYAGIYNIYLCALSL